MECTWNLKKETYISFNLSCTHIVAKCYSFRKRDEVVGCALKCCQTSHTIQLIHINHSLNSIFLTVK